MQRDLTHAGHAGALMTIQLGGSEKCGRIAEILTNKRRNSYALRIYLLI